MGTAPPALISRVSHGENLGSSDGTEEHVERIDCVTRDAPERHRKTRLRSAEAEVGASPQVSAPR